MIVEYSLSKEISDFRIVIDNILSKVENDSLSYDSLQIQQQENYHSLYEKLKKCNLEKLLIEAKNKNLSKDVFHGILSCIGNYNKIYQKRSTKFSSFDYGKLYELYLFEKYAKKISILQNDIAEVEDPDNLLPQYEKVRLVGEFKKELLNLTQQRDSLPNDFRWFFNNYYEIFFNLNQLTQKLIHSYFPEQSLELESDLFRRHFISDLYDLCEQNRIFDSEKVAFENFYLILNQRHPVQRCLNSIDKKTIFGFPIKHMSLRIKDKLRRQVWIEHVCKEFGLNARSINSHGNNKNISTEPFYDLFDVKIQS